MKDTEKGIHVYLTEHSDKCEILFYYNKQIGKNLYISQKMNARLIENVLIVNIIEDLASNDEGVCDKLISYVVVNERPKEIVIYLNKEKQLFELESGNVEILQ